MKRLADFLERWGRNRPRLYLVVVLLVLLPRLAFVAVAPERNLHGGSVAMLAVADNLRLGRGYVNQEGETDVYFNPGHILFLAACRAVSPDSFVFMKLAQVAFDTVTALALTWLMLQVLPVLSVLLFGVAFAFHPLFIHYANNVNDEPLLSLLLALSVVCLWVAVRRGAAGWFALAGLVAGAATLTKGTAFLVPLVGAPLLGWILRKHPGLSPSRWLLYLAVYLLALLPWTFRNYIVSGHFSFNTRGGGKSFWWGSDPAIFAHPNKPIWEAAADVSGRLAEEGIRPPQGVSQFEMEEWYFERGMQNYRRWVRQPAALARLIGLKAMRLWYASENRPRWHAPAAAPQLALACAAVVGWIRLRRAPPGRPLAILLALYVGCFYLVGMLGIPMVRYFSPVLPLVLVAAASAFSPRQARVGAAGTAFAVSSHTP